MSRTVRVQLSIVSMLVMLSLLAGVFLPVGSVQAREGGSLPISPKGMVTDTTPTFKWYFIPTAAKYEFELYKGTTKVYSKTAWPAVCGATYCTTTPAAALSLGSYKWRIRYYVGSTPQTWSLYLKFSLVPPPIDFNSQFNGSSATDWTSNPGAVWLFSGTSLYTNGIDGKRSSIYQNASPAYTNFDIVVRMRRVAMNDNGNYLMLRMGPNFGDLNEGYAGYLFGYSNLGDYMVWKYDSTGMPTPIQTWTLTPYVVQDGWNKLRVTAIGPYFNFYINGKLVYAFEDNSRTMGSVGFAMYDTGKLEVDWANLRVLLATAVRSSDVVDPEQQALNEAAMQGGSSSSPEHPID